MTGAPRRKIPTQIQWQIRQRAHSLCEYCHAAEHWQYVPFTVDHVIPLAQGSEDALDNLALACFHCNRRKADKRTARDPDSGEEVPLFNPRHHRWNDHFAWSADGLFVIGLTATGRTTIEALALNRERILPIRAADIAVGRDPPAGDTTEKPKSSSHYQFKARP